MGKRGVEGVLFLKFFLALVLGRTKHVLTFSGLLYEMSFKRDASASFHLCKVCYARRCRGQVDLLLTNMRLHGMVFKPSAFRRQSSHLPGLRNPRGMRGVQAFCFPTIVTTSLRASTSHRHAWCPDIVPSRIRQRSSQTPRDSMTIKDKSSPGMCPSWLSHIFFNSSARNREK